VVSPLIGWCQACLEAPLPTIEEADDEEMQEADDEETEGEQDEQSPFVSYASDDESESEEEVLLDANGFPRARKTIDWHEPESSGTEDDCSSGSDDSET